MNKALNIKYDIDVCVCMIPILSLIPRVRLLCKPTYLHHSRQASVRNPEGQNWSVFSDWIMDYLIKRHNESPSKWYFPPRLTKFKMQQYGKWPR